METGISAKIEPSEGVYHILNSRIVYDSPLVNRIILQNGGEIHLEVTGNELICSSKRYSNSGNLELTHKIIKKLIPGYNPMKALENARKSIIQRVVDLVMEKREMNSRNEIENYLNNQGKYIKRERDGIFGKAYLEKMIGIAS